MDSSNNALAKVMLVCLLCIVLITTFLQMLGNCYLPQSLNPPSSTVCMFFVGYACSAIARRRTPVV